MPSLADLQNDFANAIRHPGAPLPDRIQARNGMGARQRFNVYRNNFVIGLTEALGMTFPVVQKLVGDEFFHVAAREYILNHPPHSPVLLLYGETFGDFLDQLPGTSKFPWLGDVARLEWCRVFALNAAEAAVKDIACLTLIPTSKLADTRLIFHPSIRLLSSPWPVHSIWQDCLSDTTQRGCEIDQAQWLMITRPGSQVLIHCLDADSFFFCQCLLQECPLGIAAERVVQKNPEVELSTLLGMLFRYEAVMDIHSAFANNTV